MITTSDKPQQLLATSGAQDHRPLLGYDWIAGVMDNNSTLGGGNAEKSPELFSDDVIAQLGEFRQKNKEECVSRRKWDEMMRTPKTPKQKEADKMLQEQVGGLLLRFYVPFYG